MVKVAFERNIHFKYSPEFITHWNEQSQEMKDYCDNLGQQYGYSAMNVFYTFIYQYWAHKESGIARKAFSSS